MTFPEVFSPYVAQSDLSNPLIWPELGSVRSPEPVAVSRPVRNHAERNSTGLSYSTTIVGKNNVGAGMRVDGKQRNWTGRKPRAYSNASDSVDTKGKGRALEEEIPEQVEDLEYALTIY